MYTMKYLLFLMICMFCNASNTKENVNHTKENMNNKMENYNIKKKSLNNTRENMNYTKEILNNTKENVSNTKENLNNTKENLNNTKVNERYSQEPLGNIVDISWKLPSDGGGGDSQCARDIIHMYNSLENMTLWAVRMWESTAGMSSGWGKGSIYQLGNFDECLEGGFMETQYCLATVTIMPQPKQKPIKQYVQNFSPLSNFYDTINYSGDIAYLKRNVLYWGICSPASCSQKELQNLMQGHIDSQLIVDGNRTNPDAERPIIIAIPGDTCQTTNMTEPLGIGAQIFFWVSGIVLMMTIFVSMFHCYLLHTDPDRKDTSSIVRSFSAIGHLKYLNKNGSNDGGEKGLEILWGIRVVSIMFIICGHAMGTRMASSVFNRNFVEQEYHDMSSIIVTHADVVVDSFFVLSGILSIYGILKSQTSTKYYPTIVFYRYVRFVVPYAVVIAFYALVFPSTGTGPTWHLIDDESRYCRQNWWLNLFMINNYINVDRMCMTHSWYIPCDFHFFLITLLLAALFKDKRQSLTVISVLSIIILAAMLSPAVITYIRQMPGTMLFLNDFLTNPRNHRYFLEMYIASHTRAAPYFIGTLTGYLIHKYRKPDNEKIFSTLFSTVAALSSLMIMLSVLISGSVFYEPNHAYSVIEASIYAALERSVWAMALCALILCCVLGTVPFVVSFLGWSAWIPLGKLVYGAYITHMGLVLRTAALTRTPFYLSKLTMLAEVCGDAVIAFMFSLFLYLVYEAPFKTIIGYIIKAFIKSPKNKEVNRSTGKDMPLSTAQDADVEKNAVFTKKYDNNIRLKDNNVTSKF